MQWGFRKSVHQNGKIVESASKYLNNPYLLDESAEHRTHHPESEGYSDEQHVQNLHKAFKDARRKMTDKEISRNGSLQNTMQDIKVIWVFMIQLLVTQTIIVKVNL